MQKQIVRVLLFDGDQDRCRALAAALETSDDPPFRVIPVWTSLDDALAALVRHPYHVILLDVGHPHSRGQEALVAMRDVRPGAAVVVLADRTVDADVSTALKLGAYDYLLRDEIHSGVVVRVTRYAALRKMAEDRERRTAFRYRQLFRDSMDAVLLIDPVGRPLDVNQAAVELLGVAGSPDSWTLYDRLVEPAQREQVRLALGQGDALAGVEVRVHGAGGSERTCLLSAAVHAPTDDGEAVHHAILRDITQRKEAEERLAYNALHDPLTGLPNRALLMDRLEQAAARLRRRPDHPCTVLFLDIDRFKRVNDRFGHPAGDRMLIQAGRSITGSVRVEDTVARIGGDEFAVLLDGSDFEEAQEVADRILEDLQRPFPLEGATVSLTASIGIAGPGPEGFDPAILLRDADTAMYRAKSIGRGRWQLFDPAMHDESQKVLTLESELRGAITDRALQLVFQPIYGARGGEVRGFEALVRWNHPQKGLLQPAAFIPFAEESGLVVDLGEWVFREACRQMVSWTDGSAADGYVSVNVSPKQFMQPDLVQRIMRILAETGAPPHRLKLELTESALMLDAERTVRMLHELRDMGLDVWIDDFGTGYSSLAYLQRFPVSAVKIERSFVARMGETGGDRKGDELVRMIISLAQSLDLATVAEGVETPAQLRRLRAMGTSDMQGYLLSLPVPGDEVEALTLRRPSGFGGGWPAPD